MNKTVRIILLVLGAAIAALAIAGLAGIPGQRAALEEAVYLDEPVVLPENEGRRVIIHGKVEMTGPAYDAQLGLTLQTPKAFRYNEQYQKTGTEDGQQTYDWVSRGTATVTGAARVGEFHLANELTALLPADKVYDAFDPAEIARYDVQTLLGGTETYVLEQGHRHYKKAVYDTGGWLNTAAWREARERDGARSWHYRYFDAAARGEMTIAGVQKNGYLHQDEAFTTSIMSGVKTKEDFRDAGTAYLAGGAGAFLLLGLFMIYKGLRKPRVNARTT